MGRIILRDNQTSGSVPQASELELAELVINTTDGFLYSKNAAGTVLRLNNQTVSASYALTASHALNGGGSGPAPESVNTASYAITLEGQSGSFYRNASNINAGTLDNARLPSQINITGYSGSFTGSFIGSASFATTAGTALAVDYTRVANKPTLVSSSAQINSGSFTGSFTGSATNAVSASFAQTALTANSSTTADAVAFANITGKPTLVSSSIQVDHNATTNYDANRHFLQSDITTVGTVTVGNVNAILPAGTVSSSIQINTGSFTGSFTGSVLGSASYALSASYAANGGGASSETASYAHTASYSQFSRTIMVVAFSGSGATFVQHYPLSLNQWSFATSTSTAPSVNYIYIYPFIAPTNANSLTFKLKTLKVYHTTTMDERRGSFAIYSNKQVLLQPDTLLYSSSATLLPTGDTEVTADLTLEAGRIYWVAFHRNIGGTIQVASGNNSVNTLYGSAFANPGTYISAMRSASEWGDSGSYAPAWPSTINWADFGNQSSSTHAINIAGSFAIIE